MQQTEGECIWTESFIVDILIYVFIFNFTLLSYLVLEFYDVVGFLFS